jgi:hypothetical protein
VRRVESMVANGVLVDWVNKPPKRLAPDRDWVRRATLPAPLDHGTRRLDGDPPRIERIPVGATP